ncbi:MAG: DUF1971 domain-containing protein [Pseudomonadota bacterium]
MTQLPDDLRPYHSTPTFDASSVPAALTARHSTKLGVWGCIQVTAGSLSLTRIDKPSGSTTSEIIEAGTEAIVAPQEPHFVTLAEDAEFRVTFFRKKRAAAPKPDQ